MVDVTQVKLAVDSTDVPRATKQLQTMQKAGQSVQQSSKGIGKSLSGSFSGATTAKIQNASFQLQDIAVQLEMGTSATRALSQQLPQLLGGFGALGAVLGTVVGIGLPLAALMFDTSDGTDSAAEATEKYEASLRDLKDIQQELARVEAERNGNLDEFIKKQSLANLNEQVKIAQKSLDALFEQAEKFNIEAGDFADFDRAFGEANKNLAEAVSNLENADEALSKIATNEALIKTERDARKLLETMQPLLTAQVEYRKEQELLNFAARQNIITEQERLVLLDELANKYAEQLDPFNAAIENLNQEDALLRMTNEERKVEIRLRKEINNLRKSGVTPTQEQENELRERIQANEELKDQIRNVQKAEQDAAKEAENAKRKQKQLGDEIAGAFTRGASSAKSFSDALRNIGSNLLSLLQNKLVGGLTNQLGNVFASAIGGGFGGFFADGGRPPMGKVSVVGERGPELFIPDRAGTIVPNHAIGGMGGGTVINADLRGASVEAVQRLERFVSQINATLEPRAIAAVTDRRQRDPSLFGA